MARSFINACAILLIGVGLLQKNDARGQGIPEPNLVLYGVITAQSPQGPVRLTTGTLTWEMQLSGEGPPITVSASLTNINDQFSYVAYVPLETAIPGIAVSEDALKVTANSVLFTRANVTIDGVTATFAQPSQSTFSLSSLDRGTLERVDLIVDGVCPDEDENGLPDCWEEAFFGFAGVNPNGDDDGDGSKNGDEFKAGTNPKNAASLFAFVTTEQDPGGGMRVEWSSVEGKTYILERSEDLLTGYAPIASNLQDTAPKNSYLDDTVADANYFYRMRIQE